MGEGMSTWVIVLVRDLDSAKQRLGPALGLAERRKLARRNATRAIRAASAGDRRLGVAGSGEAPSAARGLGAGGSFRPRPGRPDGAGPPGIRPAVKGRAT